MKTLNKALELYNNNPEEAISTVSSWLEQAELALNNTPRVVRCSYNSGHGDSVVNYGEVRQDIFKARELEVKRLERIYQIVNGMDGEIWNID